MPTPNEGDFPVYFSKYISKVNSGHLSEAVQQYAEPLLAFYTQLPEDKADHAYAPGKWTLKEVLQHVIDAERVFSYRLMCMARKDKTPLPSFDENTYASNSLAGNRTFSSLKEEFAVVRKSTDLLIASLNEDQLAEQGVSSNKPATANSIGFVIFGHLLHHKEILEERYL